MKIDKNKIELVGTVAAMIAGWLARSTSEKVKDLKKELPDNYKVKKIEKWIERVIILINIFTITSFLKPTIKELRSEMISRIDRTCAIVLIMSTSFMIIETVEIILKTFRYKNSDT